MAQNKTGKAARAVPNEEKVEEFGPQLIKKLKDYVIIHKFIFHL